MSLTIGLGLTMPRPVTGGTGTSESEIVGIITAAGGGALYHPMNPDTAYQERTAGGTTLSGDAGPIGTLRDIGGGGYHAVAPSDAARPILTAGAIYQATYDDVDDDLQASLPALGSVCTTWYVSDRGLIVRDDVRHIKAGNYRLPRYGLRAFGIIPGALTPSQRALLEDYHDLPDRNPRCPTGAGRCLRCRRRHGCRAVCGWRNDDDALRIARLGDAGVCCSRHASGRRRSTGIYRAGSG